MRKPCKGAKLLPAHGKEVDAEEEQRDDHEIHEGVCL